MEESVKLSLEQGVEQIVDGSTAEAAVEKSGEVVGLLAQIKQMKTTLWRRELLRLFYGSSVVIKVTFDVPILKTATQFFNILHHNLSKFYKVMSKLFHQLLTVLYI